MALFHPLLPDRGERGPAIESKRRTVNGILWVLRTGAPWRDMAERYGNCAGSWAGCRVL